jgi:hypothetical protein
MTVTAYPQRDPVAADAFWRALPRIRFAEPEPDPTPAIEPAGMIYAAFACCPCGVGLARMSREPRWTCADIIKRTAVGSHHTKMLDANLPPECGSITTRRLDAK